MERRGASPAARKECRATPRRARMERETLAETPSPSPRPGRRPGAARATATRRRRGRRAEPDTHPAPGSSTPAFALGGFEPPTFCSPRGREEGRWARKRKGRAVRALCPLSSGRSRPCARLPSPLASGAAPPPAWPALIGGTPLTPGWL